MRLALDPPREPSAYAFRHEVGVRFAETDAMGVVHHASYLLYLEEARVRMLDEIGHPYTMVREGGLDLVVLECHVRYRRPFRFGDRLTCHVGVGAATRTTFQVAYLLEAPGGGSADAVTVHGAIDADGRPVRLPGWVSELGRSFGLGPAGASAGAAGRGGRGAG